ncbi:MAG TPA: hypothetical protein VMV15_09665 [Candidatus Binataceae bacterium]|nr:hypothetical protein [Candidatus Binataceae bacterium]
MPHAVTLKEIEKIFAVLEPLGVSREAVIIPLRPEHPGRIRRLPNGKLEIIVERDDAEFEAWLTNLARQVRELMGPQPD